MPSGPVSSGFDEPSPDTSTGQSLSQGAHLSGGKRPCPVYGSKAKKHKADNVDFDTVSLYASDEEDDTPSLTPLIPKYTTIWDVGCLLDYLQTLWPIS